MTAMPGGSAPAEIDQLYGSTPPSPSREQVLLAPHLQRSQAWGVMVSGRGGPTRIV
jgi:hypothetical protein